LIGDIKSNLSQLKKLGWTVKNRELQPIDGFQGTININGNGNYNGFGSYHSDNEDEEQELCQRNERCNDKFQSEVDELRERSDDLVHNGLSAKKVMSVNKMLSEVEKALEKEGPSYDKLQQKLDKAEAELDDLEENMDENEAERSSSKSTFSVNISDDDDNGDGASVNTWGGSKSTKLASKFDTWLVNELKNDGYISNTKTYNFVWNERYMRVAGKTVSDKNRLKYVAMHQRITGNPMGKTFTITRNVSGN
jgi:hypothetical protein